MPDSAFFLLTCGPENVSKATRCFQFALLSKRAGNDVTVFLVDDAVGFCNPELVSRVHAPTGDSLEDHMTSFLKEGGAVCVCTPCAKIRGIEADGLPEGFRMSTGIEAIALAEKGQLWSF